MKDKNYNEVKNIIHNDMGITKEYIRDIIEQCAREQIRLHINGTFNEFDLVEITNNLIRQRVKESLMSYPFTKQIAEVLSKKI